MMNQKILDKRYRIYDIAKKYEAKNIRIFGSQLRGSERQNSDIDLIVEFGEPNLLDRIRMKHDLEEELGMPVDLLTDDSLHPLLRDEILSEAKPL